MEEIWKKIEEHPNYSVSNLGRVRNDKRDKILKPYLHTDGYLCVELNCKRYKLHRLVAKAFIPNPDNFLVVNHKDEIKTNCVAENLEWCTQQYNIKYSLPKHTEITGKKILQIDSNGNIVKEWASISEASRGLCVPRHIIFGCCNNNTGFNFKYKE